MMLSKRCLSIALLFAALTGHQVQAAVVLYNPGAGTLPGSQGWLSVVGGSSSESFSGGLTSLNTMASQANQAGYFSENPFDGSGQLPSMPVLNRGEGFTLQFQMRVVEESHAIRDDNSDGLSDRAGFSVLMITQDLFGLELGFFADRIWAYASSGEGNNSLFTQAEGADFDTTAAVVEYELEVSGDTYSLMVNDSELLAGDLRNYNPSGVPALLNPYDNPSFLFFGDNTTSAASHVQIGTIAVVPEASSGFLLMISSLLASACHRRRRICS